MVWEIVKLGELCRIELGKTPSRSNKNYWDESKVNNNIWLSIADLPLSDKSIMLDSKEYISNAGAKLCKIVPKGTLIVSFKLSLGRLAVTGRDLYTNEAIAALYIHDKQKIDQNYLSWYLTFFDWDAAAGSDIKVKGKTLNKAKLKEIEIVVPPILEQKRIVTILDQAFSDIEQARAKTEQNLKNARELFESYLQQVFSQRGEGWVEKTLADVCLFENGDRGKNYPSRSKFVDSGVAFINAGHIDDGTVDFEKMNYITKENYDLLSRGKIEKGDVLFCLRGSLGKFAVIDDDIRGAIASSLVIIRPHSDLSIEFFLHYLRSGLCKSMIDKYAGGAAQPNLGAKDLAKFSISVPTEDQQKIVSSKLNDLMGEIDKLEFIYRDKLAAIGELKKSILQKAFSGELTKALEVDKNKGVVA